MNDKTLRFSDAQSLAGAPGNILSDGWHSTYAGKSAGADTAPIGGPLLNDIGRNHAPLFAQITTAVVASGGAATIDFQLCQADDAAARTSPSSSRPARIAKATLVAGYQPAVGPTVPPGRITQKCVGMRYVSATNTIDSGNVSSGLYWDRETNTSGL
jgi:hypothetical protein